MEKNGCLSARLPHQLRKKEELLYTDYDGGEKISTGTVDLAQGPFLFRYAVALNI